MLRLHKNAKDILELDIFELNFHEDGDLANAKNLRFNFLLL